MPASNVMSLAIDTNIPQDAEKVVGKEEWEQATSPGPHSPVLYLKEDKDTLAYEHDRQKYKKTLDRAKNKARKAFGWGNGGGSPRRASHGLPAPEWSIKAGEEDKELASEYFQVGNVQVHRVDAMICTGPLFTEVKLADLVNLAAAEDDSSEQAKGATKKKRTRVGKGGLDGEYEVVPQLRSVIVLEEQNAPDMDWDDWECVDDEESSGDGAEKKILAKTTYATVAAAAVEVEAE